MDVTSFKKLPLLGIIRGLDVEDTEDFLEHVISAGLKSIEVTMNTPDVSRIIPEMRRISNGRLSIGAGTVITKDQLKTALDAGAEFIVMPSLVEDVVSHCVDKKIPVFPGAFTPNEVLRAWNAGATMVKVFPCGMFGPKYIKELKGPLDKVKLMAVGEVQLEEIEEYFSAGASAVAFGESVFKRSWLADKDFLKIKELIEKYVDAVKRNS